MLKLRYIDALRGLAILAVVIVHTSMVGNNKQLPDLVTHVLGRGANGVQLFFFISAFTLFLSMHTKSGEDNFIGNFFIRRFFRIAPMYYLAIIYYLWQDGFGGRYWLGDAPGITGGNIIANVLFLHGFNPYWINSLVPGGWSIAVEMLFYLIIPFLFYKVNNAQKAAIFFILSVVFRYLLDMVFRKFHLIDNNILWYNYIYFYFPSQLPVFALGVLFYFVIKDNYQLKVKPYIILIAATFLLMQYVGIVILPDYIFCTIAFFVLALALSKYEYKIIVNTVIVYMGKISFSMYLTHFAVLNWLTKYNMLDFISVSSPITAMGNYAIRLSLVLAITVAVSTVLYKFVELPMQRIGYFFIKKREAKMALRAN